MTSMADPVVRSGVICDLSAEGERG